jgi:hypothetical protein
MATETEEAQLKMFLMIRGVSEFRSERSERIR